MNPNPIYTPLNCTPAYKLYWSLAIFWQEKALAEENWLEALRPLTEKDGTRVLEYRLKSNRTSQFLLSTRPEVSPSSAIRTVKGRLQHHIREQIPKAFKKNYSIKSVGPGKLDVIQAYLDKQLDHHRMADSRVQTRFAMYQIDQPDVNLSKQRHSAHGLFCYNLHLVLVHAERWREIRDDRLSRTNEMIQRTASKKKHILSKVRLLADHIHLTPGCRVAESPMDVALAYLNNIAYGHAMQPLFQAGFYVGTFGAYDLGAIRHALG